jgi:hypothetical protein
VDVFLVGLTHAGAPYRVNPSITGCSGCSTFTGLQSGAAGRYWRYSEILFRVESVSKLEYTRPRRMICKS